MTLPDKNSNELQKKFSRRNMLRSTAIAAAGAIALPTFLTSCQKEVWDVVKGHIHDGGPGGVGGVKLTPDDLAQAAGNLITLRQLLIEVYDLAKQYDDAVFHALHSTKPDTWSNFLADLFIDIAVLITGALAAGTGGTAAMPAIAFIFAVLKDWGFGKDRPSNLEGVFSDFEFGRVAMQDALEDKLSHLVEPSNNYSNLQEAWKDPIELNGKTYTLGDLASQKFTLGDEYNKLHDAGYTEMKKAVWSLLIMKCCTYKENDQNIEIMDNLNPYADNSLTSYLQSQFYPDNKGVYVRATGGQRSGSTVFYSLVYWNLGINGNPFPDVACSQLFMDDTPGHLINPDGLFNRTYLFEQFSLKKPEFLKKAHELGSWPRADLDPSQDDWEYTGGMFPRLAGI